MKYLLIFLLAIFFIQVKVQSDSDHDSLAPKDKAATQILNSSGTIYYQ